MVKTALYNNTDIKIEVNTYFSPAIYVANLHIVNGL